MSGLTYWVLELIKLSVIIGCKRLPLDPKDFFIVAECTKLLVVGLVMFGIELAKPDTPNTENLQEVITMNQPKQVMVWKKDDAGKLYAKWVPTR
jgi:hypothetical protein